MDTKKTVGQHMCLQGHWHLVMLPVAIHGADPGLLHWEGQGGLLHPQVCYPENLKTLKTLKTLPVTHNEHGLNMPLVQYLGLVEMV